MQESLLWLLIKSRTGELIKMTKQERIVILNEDIHLLSEKYYE